MHTNSFTTGKIARTGATLFLTGALAIGFTPLPAQADTSLEALQNAAIEAGNTYQTAQDKANALQAEIDAHSARVAEIEKRLPVQRERASAAIRSHYKMQQGRTSLLDMILSAQSFNQFISQLTYIDAVVSARTSEITELSKLESELTSTKASLQTEKALADQETAEAQKAYAAAEATKNAAILQAQKDAEAAQAAYEALAAAGSVQEPTIQAIQQSAQASDSSQDGSGNAGSPSAPAASYTYVLASMYGEGDGFMYCQTASGDIVTPTSMGVAMKTMPLGTIIEISYNGNVTRAVVNDRGPYVGNRQIDLQPAVAHALGFDGVGTVGYRVVG